ncbi:MAG: hypothetical protein GOV01_02410 [Candidatus Altiarchaeota archaeon]|nr:hypothetical protein [Candidatus Altiarchaeota archaeon]
MTETKNPFKENNVFETGSGIPAQSPSAFGSIRSDYLLVSLLSTLNTMGDRFLKYKEGKQLILEREIAEDMSLFVGYDLEGERKHIRGFDVSRICVGGDGFQSIELEGKERIYLPAGDYSTYGFVGKHDSSIDDVQYQNLLEAEWNGFKNSQEFGIAAAEAILNTAYQFCSEFLPENTQPREVVMKLGWGENDTYLKAEISEENKISDYFVSV